MNTSFFKRVYFLMAIIALVSASSWHQLEYRNSIKNNLKPTEWLSISELENLPDFHEITLEKLEEMTVQEGADLLNKIYHLSQIGQAIQPSFVPNPSEIPCFIVTPDSKKVKFKLSELPTIVQEQNDFGDQEVTLYITGLPQSTATIQKATSELIQAYMQRYSAEAPQHVHVTYADSSGENNTSSSEEDYSASSNKTSGNLVVIGLGEVFVNIQDYVAFDVEKTGREIADILVECTTKGDFPHEVIHLIGSNIAAHVAGAVGRHYTSVTGRQLRRITGLDPSRIYARTQNTLRGLARGDAEFVDVIHSSAYGLGTPIRCGDVDFYPNGPSKGVPGADNVVEASMRAICYYAESVVPGNERNFPAVNAISLKQFQQHNDNGKSVYMGINTAFDVEGDFILQVNSKSPFGRGILTQHQQQHYHVVYKPWKTS